MSKNYEKEIQTMQRLINYGKSEELNESRGSSAVEYHMTAADGKTYGIVREGKKFYIKVAPPKDTPLVTEDYEYIGGFNNKKFNEYPTYTIASNSWTSNSRASTRLMLQTRFPQTNIRKHNLLSGKFRKLLRCVGTLTASTNLLATSMRL